MALNIGIVIKTAAETFDVAVADGASIKLWTYPNLARDEVVRVFQTDGAFVESELVLDKRTVCLTFDNNAVKLNGPGTYRIKKPVTATATQIMYDN